MRHGTTTFNFSSRLLDAIPYEVIAGGTGQGITATQQPYGWGNVFKPGLHNGHPIFNTDLATYMGVNSGAMTALFHQSNVAGIFQIDLVATDLPKPNAYPTYLFYNPTTDQPAVSVDVGLARAPSAASLVP